MKSKKQKYVAPINPGVCKSDFYRVKCDKINLYWCFHSRIFLAFAGTTPNPATKPAPALLFYRSIERVEILSPNL